MVTRSVQITNRQGLHLRVAARVVLLTRKLRARITVGTGQLAPANGNSITDLLRLGAVRGTHVTVQADGPDAEQAVKQVTEIFIDGAGI